MCYGLTLKQQKINKFLNLNLLKSFLSCFGFSYKQNLWHVICDFALPEDILQNLVLESFFLYMYLSLHLLLSIHFLPWFNLPWIWLSDTSLSNPRPVLLGIQTKISKPNFIILDSNKSSSSHFPTIDVEITIFMSIQLGILENNFSFAPLFCLQISFPIL